MDAVKSDLYWIHWILPVGLRVQRAFETVSSVFRISVCRGYWQRWDATWKGRGQGRWSKTLLHIYQINICFLTCLASCSGEIVCVAKHTHACTDSANSYKASVSLGMEQTCLFVGTATVSESESETENWKCDEGLCALNRNTSTACFTLKISFSLFSSRHCLDHFRAPDWIFSAQPINTWKPISTVL